jgi:hypothetical protein
MGVGWEQEHIDGVCPLFNFTTFFAYALAVSRFVAQILIVTLLGKLPHFSPSRRPRHAERQPPARLDQRYGAPT